MPFLLMKPASSAGNCLPGKVCNLPNGFPPIKGPTPKTKKLVNKIDLNGKFNGSIGDPEYGPDNSFIYYLELVYTENWQSWEDTRRINQNTSCIACDPVSLTLEHKVGWTNSETLGLNVGLAVGAPPAVTTLGTTLSKTFGINEEVTIELKKDFLLDCCSNTRFTYVLNHEVSHFKIGWQQDDIYGWTDKGFDFHTTEVIGVGLGKEIALGSCVPSPVSIMGIGAFLAHSHKLRARIKSDASRSSNLV